MCIMVGYAVLQSHFSPLLAHRSIIIHFKTESLDLNIHPTEISPKLSLSHALFFKIKQALCFPVSLLCMHVSCGGGEANSPSFHSAATLTVTNSNVWWLKFLQQLQLAGA